MLQNPKTSLNDHVLQYRARGDVNGAAFGSNDNDGSLESDIAAQVDCTADCEVVELKDAGDT